MREVNKIPFGVSPFYVFSIFFFFFFLQRHATKRLCRSHLPFPPRRRRCHPLCTRPPGFSPPLDQPTCMENFLWPPSSSIALPLSPALGIFPRGWGERREDEVPGTGSGVLFNSSRRERLLVEGSTVCCLLTERRDTWTCKQFSANFSICYSHVLVQ